MKEKYKRIQHKLAITQVISCLLQNPSLLLDSKYAISVEDFPEKFHKILIGSMINLYNQGILVFDVPTVCNYLSDFPNQLKIFQDNDGLEYIDKFKSLAEMSNFDTNYSTVKKFTILRDLAEDGTNITDLYNYIETDVEKIEAMNRKLYEMSCEDIINHYMLKLSSIQSKHDMENTDVAHFKASEGAREYKERLKLSPEVGAPFVNEFFTSVYRGMRRGKVILETADTGTGKTRKMVANSCNLRVPYIYDIKKGDWVATGVPLQRPIFINTELDKEEIQTMFWAYLSGVNEEHILLNQYEEGEEKRVDQAIALLEEYDIPIVTISDYDISDIKRIIVQYVLQDNITHVFFDYIHSTTKSLSYYSRMTHTKLQEHQVLFLLGIELKQLARKYKLFVYSATQGNEAIKDSEMRDNRATRGAKSLSDKVDGHFITFNPNQQDIDKLKDIIMSNYGFVPNTGYSVFKNRGGKLKNIYLWTIIDLGNMREKCLFATDKNYVPIPIKILDVIMNSDDNVKNYNIEAEEYIEEY